MKVLMTALQPGGGIRTFFRYIYSQPDFKDDTFTLIAPDADGKLSAFLQTNLGQDRFRVISVHSGILDFVRSVRSSLASDNFELLHSHGFSAGLLTQLAITARKSPPHLMTAHDVFLHSQFTGWKGKARKLAMAQLFSRIDSIHTVTEDATGNFTTFFPGVRADRLKPILHGVDTEFFSQGEPAELRSELGIPASTPLIGFFGRFMGQKGFRTLVDAMLAIKQEGIEPLPRVLTFGWGGFIREDYEYLTNLGMADQFLQLPATDNMPAMIKAVDMVVMPSRWEACGLLAMEVLSAGVPLLSTDCIGLREVVAGSPTRIFSPGSAEGLAAAIKAEIADPSGGRFLDYQPIAVERFHIGRPAAELRALYDELAGQTS